ncbi:MAG: sulfatase-like hydrolase/transferase, partial [Planctomycetota bacterium]
MNKTLAKDVDLFVWLPFVMGALLVLAATHATAADRPNVILIITDDQGYSDVGYNGNPWLQTPVLDELASRSTVFDRFYASPVCSPTRASLMTGRY